MTDEITPATSDEHQHVRMNPRAYLEQFYTGVVDPGNRALLAFYARIYADLKGKSMLEFGGGPTIYSLITAAQTARMIHFCDANPDCLKEIKDWLAGDPASFNWTHFIAYALSCENNNQEQISSEAIQIREQLIRQCIQTLSLCDIFAADPLLGSSLGPYDIVANTFCLDSIVDAMADWIHLNHKLAQFVAPDGLFVTAYLLRASHWTTKGVTFPAVTLIPADVDKLYADLGFTITERHVVELENKKGYDGFIMTCGKRNLPSANKHLPLDYP